MRGDAPHLHMLNMIAGGIPASVEFCRRLGDHRAGGRRRPSCAGRRAGYLFFPPQPLLGHQYQFDLDTAEGQLFQNRMLTSLQRHEPGILTYMRCPTSRLPTTLPAGMKKT